MTSPNEPGGVNRGEGPQGDKSIERRGHRADTGASRTSDSADSPPWHRGAARASQTAHQSPPEAPIDMRPGGPASRPDARLNRFISGTAAPFAASKSASPEPQPLAGRAEELAVEAYASELPDLSGSVSRSAQRKPTSDAAPEVAGGSAAASGTRRSSIAEFRESRESPVQVSRRTRRPVRASMQIRRIDPWSTLKVSLLLSVAMFFVWMIAVAFLYLVLGGMGVWAKLNSNVGDLLNNASGSTGELVSSTTIFGGAILIGLVNIVLVTAMATLGAFVYNLTTDLIGGIEVTLADRD